MSNPLMLQCRWSSWAVVIEAESDALMELLQEELKLFASATETLLKYRVKREDLTEMEQFLIQYYLAAMAEKFPLHDQDSEAIH